jgi:uncharacterized protein involved in response to NO
VLVLHIGYAWVPIGLAFLGRRFNPGSAAIHVLTAGAMATMILAVMTRATLGHTGRELRAGPATIILYILITGGAVLRVLLPFGLMDYMAGREFAALVWAGAFVIFLFTYGPILFRPRVGEKR